MISKERIDLAKCLADLHFQDFLADAEILVRDPQAVPNTPINTNYEVGKLRQTLADKIGYIVPREELSMRVYGRQAAEDLTNIGTLSSYLKERGDLTPITHLPRIGWGYGLKDVKLTKHTIPLTYRMWLEFGEQVTEEQLSYALYGFVDSELLLYTRKLSNKAMYNLEPTKAHIVRTKRNHGQYSYTLDWAVKQRVDDYSPGYLRQRFQDWLATPSVGILKRSEPIPTPYVHKIHSRTGHQFISLLEEHYGYIVPTNFISKILFQDQDQHDKVMQKAAESRRRLVDPRYIYTGIELGLGVGIDELRLSRGGLKVLYPLWRQQGSFVSKLAFIKGLNPGQIETGLHELRRSLRGSEYEVITSIEDGYKLQATKKAPYGASLENL